MKNLTTGQMIDYLKKGDVATNQEGYKVAYDEKGIMLMWSSSDNKPLNSEENKFELLHRWVKDDIWEIEHKFVTFYEAQEAHKNMGKTIIYYHDEDMQYEFIYGESDNFEKLNNDSISLYELTIGKWIIVE